MSFLIKAYSEGLKSFWGFGKLPSAGKMIMVDDSSAFI